MFVLDETHKNTQNATWYTYDTDDKLFAMLLLQEPNIVEDIKFRRLRWAGHIIRMEEQRIPKKGLKRQLPYCETSEKTKN